MKISRKDFIRICKATEMKTGDFGVTLRSGEFCYRAGDEIHFRDHTRPAVICLSDGNSWTLPNLGQEVGILPPFPHHVEIEE